MSERSRHFVERWTLANVCPQPDAEDSDFLADKLAMDCLLAGEAEGLSLRELEEDLGTDLASHIWFALTTPRHI